MSVGKLVTRWPKLAMFAALLGTAILTSDAHAADLPSMRVEEAAAVTPSNALTIYGSSTLHTNSISGYVRPIEITEAAKALGSERLSDKDFTAEVYRFVKFKVRTTPLFGLQKGGLGALIDRNGTSFDQAHLMVELLRAGGVSAEYRVGTVSHSYAEVANWLGLSDKDDTVNSVAIEDMLANGGIPFEAMGSTITLLHIWVYASLSDGNYMYDPSFKTMEYGAGIDLATSANYSDNGFNAVAAPTVGSGDVSNVSYSSAGTPDVIRGALKGYASGLYDTVEALQNEYPADHTVLDLEAIAGGFKIDTTDEFASIQHVTSLPHVNSTDRTWSGEIPDQYRTSLRLRLRESSSAQTYIFDHTLFADETYGRQIEFRPDIYDSAGFTQPFNSNWALDLKVDRTTVASLSQALILEPYNRGLFVEITRDHPYAANSGNYLDRAVEMRANFVGPVAVVAGWGYTGANYSTKIANETYDEDNNFFGVETNQELGTTTAPSAQDATKIKLSASWLSQFSRMYDLQSFIGAGLTQHHSTVGLVWAESQLADTAVGGFDENNVQNKVFYVSDEVMRLNLDTSISVTSKTNNQTDEIALAYSIAAAASTLEGSVLEQALDVVDTASTAARFDWGQRNYSSTARFYEFVPGDEASVDDLILRQGQDRDNLTNDYLLFGTGGAGLVKKYLAEGYNVVAFNDDFLGPGYIYGTPSSTTPNTYNFSDQRGAAFIAYKPAGGSIGHVVSSWFEDSKGGGGGAGNDYQEAFDPRKAGDFLKDKFVDLSSHHGVSLANGKAGYTTPTLLKTGSGEFPAALPLSFTVGSRSVLDQAVRHQHNFDQTASISGSGMEAMGLSNPINAAHSIIAFYVAQQQIKQGVTLANLVKLPFIYKWWADGLTYNVVTVKSGSSAKQFVKKPHADGSFTPPAGSIDKLEMTGSRTVKAATQTSRFNRYEYDGIDLTLTLADGSVQQYDGRSYSVGGATSPLKTSWPISSWTFPHGAAVSYSYYDVVHNPNGEVKASVYGPRLTFVSNNFNRSLTFSYEGTLHELASVADDTGRSVSVDASLSAFEYVQPHATSDSAADNTFKIQFSDKLTSHTATKRPSNDLHITAVYDPRSRSDAALEYRYNGLHTVSEILDAEAVRGARNSYEISLLPGQIGSRTNPLDNSYTVFYDRNNNPVRFIDEASIETRAYYDGLGRVTRRVYQNGIENKFKYDAYHNVVSNTTVGTDASEIEVIASYGDGNWPKAVTSVTDANGNQTSMSYYGPNADGAGMPKEASLPSVGGQVNKYSYTYDSNGQLLTQTNPEGIKTVNTYDSFGNLATVTVDPTTDTYTGKNLKTVYQYDRVGNVCRTYGPRKIAAMSSPPDGGYTSQCDAN